ncbi:unnamed protein product [Meloidogyne enterolobii]|uniref:Uncharacterized protein n=1 Tax=Meloidogyne enterolobii TaxID=390850 RepID=A0ACB0ZHT5_MELEN
MPPFPSIFIFIFFFLGSIFPFSSSIPFYSLPPSLSVHNFISLLPATPPPLLPIFTHTHLQLYIPFFILFFYF